MTDIIKRTNGTKVAFGDVVRLCKERSKDPEADGFERYIGLEHLEPSDLKVRSWGDLSDGVTFTNVFRPGQVLFGKRRAYQRKVAVADFNGVCSGDIYVLESKSEQLLPELLPFICQSEPFYDYVIRMSQGGLSPRVNWKALEKYEFALPPLEDQRRIANVLQAVVKTLNCTQQISTAAATAYLAALKDFFYCATGSEPADGTTSIARGSKWKWRRVDEMFSLQLGKMSSKKAREGKEHAKYIKNNNVLWGEFSLDDLPMMSFNKREREKFSLEPGDLLVCEGGEIGRAAIWPEGHEDIYYQKALHRLRPKTAETSTKFFMHYLRACSANGILNRIATGGTILHLPQERLAELRLPFPSFSEQGKLIEILEALQQALEKSRRRSDHLNSLKNQLFIEGMTP